MFLGNDFTCLGFWKGFYLFVFLEMVLFVFLEVVLFVCVFGNDFICWCFWE